MQKHNNTKTAVTAAHKRAAAFNTDELLEAVVLLSGFLDETVDAVFLSAGDPGFLTERRIETLRSTQSVALILGETAALQAEGRILK